MIKEFRKKEKECNEWYEKWMEIEKIRDKTLETHRIIIRELNIRCNNARKKSNYFKNDSQFYNYFDEGIRKNICEEASRSWSYD